MLTLGIYCLFDVTAIEYVYDFALISGGVHTRHESLIRMCVAGRFAELLRLLMILEVILILWTFTFAVTLRSRTKCVRSAGASRSDELNVSMFPRNFPSTLRRVRETTGKRLEKERGHGSSRVKLSTTCSMYILKDISRFRITYAPLNMLTTSSCLLRIASSASSAYRVP